MSKEKHSLPDPSASQLFVSTSARTVSVIGISDGNPAGTTTGAKYKPGKGYMFDKDSIPGQKKVEGVWIYCTEKPLHPNTYPYFWPVTEETTLDIEGVPTSTTITKLKFSDPSDSILEAFSIKNLQDMSMVNIIDSTVEGEVLFDEQELNDINAASNFYVPIIYESDDFLKRIVKSVIIEKGININKLKSKTEEKYILPNMKAALMNKTKMSVLYFAYWMELLGCDFEITIRDDGTIPTDKLKHPLSYSSYTGHITLEVDGKKIPMDPSKYMSGNRTTNEDAA